MSNYLRVGGQDMTPEEYNETLRQAAQAVNDYGAFQNRLNYLNQLNEYKNAYAAAGNDAQKQTEAHERAEALRQAARENNVDLSVADNMNANQLQGYRQGFENEAKAKFLYRKTPEQLNAERTQFWLQNGANEKEAIKRAYYDTLPYAAQYSAEGKMLFGDRGTTDNTINSKVGVPLMMLMNDTDPEITAIASAMFAHPADEWKFDRQMEAREQIGQIARDAANNQFNNQRTLNRDNFGYRKNLLQDSNAHDLEKMRLGANLNIQTLEKQYNLMDNARKEQVKMLTEAGFDLPTAIMAVYLGGGNSGTKKDTNTGNGQQQIGSKDMENVVKELESLRKLKIDDPEEFEKQRGKYEELQDIHLQYLRGNKQNQKQNGKVDYSDYNIAIDALTDMIEDNNRRKAAGEPYYSEAQIKEIARKNGFNDYAIEHAEYKW